MRRKKEPVSSPPADPREVGRAGPAPAPARAAIRRHCVSESGWPAHRRGSLPSSATAPASSSAAPPGTPASSRPAAALPPAHRIGTSAGRSSRGAWGRKVRMRVSCRSRRSLLVSAEGHRPTSDNYQKQGPLACRHPRQAYSLKLLVVPFGVRLCRQAGPAIPAYTRIWGARSSGAQASALSQSRCWVMVEVPRGCSLRLVDCPSLARGGPGRAPCA